VAVTAQNLLLIATRCVVERPRYPLVLRLWFLWKYGIMFLSFVGGYNCYTCHKGAFLLLWKLWDVLMIFLALILVALF